MYGRSNASVGKGDLQQSAYTVLNETVAVGQAMVRGVWDVGVLVDALLEPRVHRLETWDPLPTLPLEPVDAGHVEPHERDGGVDRADVRRGFEGMDCGGRTWGDWTKPASDQPHLYANPPIHPSIGGALV